MDNSADSSNLPLLTFNSLFSLLREEKKKKTLHKLPEKFYEALNKFFQDKKNEITKLRDSSETEKMVKEKRVLKSSEKLVEELLQIRLSKISNTAIKNSIFSDDSFVENDILDREVDFFESIKKSSLKLKRSIS